MKYLLEMPMEEHVSGKKDNVGSDFFSISAFAYKSRPKCIFSVDMFFNRHLELIFHSVYVLLPAK